jgi:hypothetical protein
MAPVRAAVAGTPEAREARIATEVPQTAVVQRTTAKLDLAYDGPPRFEPIPGTTLERAVNANVPVIRVSAYAYYALQNAVWFTSITGTDGWKVADWVPPEIYSIPPDSPLHYVTYVRVYDATPTDVYVGYTPGYLGWYDGGTTVVYGTGWGYNPWIGSVWYPWPWTWGCGCCSPWWGPSFGFGFYYGWWGPAWPVFVPFVPVHAHRLHPFPHAFAPHFAGVGVPHGVHAGHAPGIIVRGAGNTVNVNNVYGNWGRRLHVTPTSPSLASPRMRSATFPSGLARVPSAAAAGPAFAQRPQVTWSRPSEVGHPGGPSGWAPGSPRPAFPAGAWAPSMHPAPPLSGALHGAAPAPQARFAPSPWVRSAPPAAPAPIRTAPAPLQPAAPSGWRHPGGGSPGVWHAPVARAAQPTYPAPAPGFHGAPQMQSWGRGAGAGWPHAAGGGGGHAAGGGWGHSGARAGGARGGGFGGRR